MVRSLPRKLIAEASVILSRPLAMWLWGNFCKDQKKGLVSKALKIII